MHDAETYMQGRALANICTYSRNRTLEKCMYKMFLLIHIRYFFAAGNLLVET